MAPLPVNSTGRLILPYTANGHRHHAQFRYAAESAPSSDYLEGLDAFLTSLAGLMPSDWVFDDYLFIPMGTNVSIPLGVAPSPVSGGVTPDTGKAPAYMDFVGRSPDGRRARVSFLGAGNSPDEEGAALSDYRWRATENSSVAAAIGFLIDVGVVTISGEVPYWKSYVNLGYNAYWQKAVRT